MTINDLSNKILGYIETKVMPKCSNIEKGVLIGIPLLVGLNLEQRISDLLNNPMLSSANIWTDESKTVLNVPLLKEFFDKWLDAVGGSYEFEGIVIDLIFQKHILFKGFTVTKETIQDILGV